jgi:DNA-binding IclR family transcriptional regulator
VTRPFGRLTDRQVAVLAAVERLGRPTLPDLRYEFPHLAPSLVYRVLVSLEKKGLIESSGNPYWRYLGVGGFGAPLIAPEEIVRFSCTRRTSRSA